MYIIIDKTSKQVISTTNQLSDDLPSHLDYISVSDDIIIPPGGLIESYTKTSVVWKPLPETFNNEYTKYIMTNGEYIDMLSNEDKWNILRTKRNRALQETDWTQMPDVPLEATIKDLWAAWRQQIRDIPQKFTNINDAVSEFDNLMNNKPN